MNAYTKAQLEDRINDSKRYDPETQIMIIWGIDDVREVMKNRRGTLLITDEIAMQVLMEAKRRHDADAGISWATIECIVDELIPA